MEFTITESEYVKANALFTRTADTTKALFAFVTIGLIYQIFSADSNLTRSLSIAALIGGFVGYMFVKKIYAPYQTRKQYRSYKAIQESTSIELEGSSICFSSSSGQSKLKVDDLIKWRENEEFLLIYPAPCLYHIIPKRIGVHANKIRMKLVEVIGNAT
jgi:hypothetical protein